MVARDYGGDLDGLVEHFGGFVSREALAEELAYAERFPEEIGRRVDENERLGRSLADQARRR